MELQWDGTHSGLLEIKKQFKDLKDRFDTKRVINKYKNIDEVKVTGWVIKTPIGEIPVKKGDWIIKVDDFYMIRREK